MLGECLACARVAGKESLGRSPRGQEVDVVSNRRIGTTDSQTRAHLLDVAEQMLLDEGYAAVTSRRLGTRAEVSSQLVHYYFRTMDDLFVELFRRRAEEGLVRVAEALQGGATLTEIWALTSNPVGARLNVEFAALANHRKEMQAVITEYGERFRRLQHDAIAARFDELGIGADECPPTVALLAMTGLAQIMAIESSFGFTTGHREATRFVSDLLTSLDKRAD